MHAIPRNRSLTGPFLVSITVLLFLALPVRAADFDPDAAMDLARKNGCFKCHPIDKKIAASDDEKKDGPPWREVAKKYKGKSDAREALATHVTSGNKVKFPDGHEEKHKVIESGAKSEINNLVGWILSL